MPIFRKKSDPPGTPAMRTDPKVLAACERVLTTIPIVESIFKADHQLSKEHAIMEQITRLLERTTESPGGELAAVFEPCNAAEYPAEIILPLDDKTNPLIAALLRELESRQAEKIETMTQELKKLAGGES